MGNAGVVSEADPLKSGVLDWSVGMGNTKVVSDADPPNNGVLAWTLGLSSVNVASDADPSNNGVLVPLEVGNSKGAIITELMAGAV